MKNRTITGHLAWPLISQAASVALGLVTSLVAARILGPSDRGLLAVVVLLALFATTVGSLGLPAAYAYFGSRSPRVPYFLASVLAFGSVGLLVTSGVVVASRRTGVDFVIIMLGALLALATAADWLAANRATAELRWRRYGIAVIVGRFGALIGTAVLAGLLNLDLGGCLAALVLAEVLVVTALRVGRRDPTTSGTASEPSTTLRAVVSYGLGSLPGTVSQFLVYRLDLFLVGLWVSLRAAGLYAVAQTFSEGLMALTRATQTAVVPLGARESDGEFASGTLRVIVRTHARVSGALAILVAMVVPPVVAVVLGDAYYGSIPLLLILLPGTWILGLGLVATSVLRSVGRPGTASWPMFVGLVVMGLADLVVIPRAGAAGAAVVSSVVYIGVGLVTVRLARRFADVNHQTPQRDG